MSTLEEALQAEAEIVSRRVFARDGGHIDINRHAHGGVTLGCTAPGCTLVVHLDSGQAREVGETLAAFGAVPGVGTPKVAAAMKHLRGLELTQRERQTLRGLIADWASEVE